MIVKDFFQKSKEETAVQERNELHSQRSSAWHAREKARKAYEACDDEEVKDPIKVLVFEAARGKKYSVSRLIALYGAAQAHKMIKACHLKQAAVKAKKSKRSS